jgi:bacteriocin-like protein
MNNPEQKHESAGIASEPPTTSDKKKASTELNEAELKKVSGGAADITVTKHVDPSSPKLFP